MHRYIRHATLALALGALVSAPASVGAAPMSRSDFRAEMRKLWDDHVAWTRLFIVSATANLPDREATTQRLLQNQMDIGNAVKPFYGEAAGNTLTGLLKDHILIAAEITDAARAGDTARKEAAVKRWQANGDEIARLLSTANPKNWPLGGMKAHMRDHLDLTAAELTAHLGKDWAGSVAAYDKAHEQILEMADMLSSGIVSQFPDKFGPAM